MRLLPASPAAALPPSTARRGAVFIDKDGTLVEDVPYNVDPALLRFTPHAIPALRQLSAAGWPLIVISNQPGIALGRFDLPALRTLANALGERLAREGVPLAGFHACPHRPADRTTGLGCACRKPAPGLLQEAAAEHGVDLDASWMIGDILDDVEAGRRAGCRAIHLDVGNETVWLRTPMRIPTVTVGDLRDAARAILGETSLDRGTGRQRSVAAMPTA